MDTEISEKKPLKKNEKMTLLKKQLEELEKYHYLRIHYVVQFIIVDILMID